MEASAMTQTLEIDAAAREGTDTAAIVRLAGVEKVFRKGRVEHAALRGIDLTIERGELVAVVGRSGSGKSTLLNVMTGIDRPTAGSVTVAGSPLHEMSEEDLAVWRGRHVGIVFQFFQLIPTLTAVENAALPMEFAGLHRPAQRLHQAAELLEMVGLGDRLDHIPSELSGGEQQRVAIARALACDPELVVADEPTGNLDSNTAGHMLELLVALNRTGTSVVYVTHDRSIAQRAHRVVELGDGRVVAGEVSS
jgi:putative ABC transport system ATP-binding protein